MKGLFTTLLIVFFFIQINAQTNYYVSTTGNDATGDGSSGNPWQTIQHAVDNLADVSATNIINIEAGTYTEIIDISTSNIVDLTLQGESTLTTIIQADVAPNTAAGRVITTSGWPATLRINNLTIQNGNTADNGGGISDRWGSLYITNCWIKDNTSTLTDNWAHGGGGIYSNDEVYATNCTFSGNTAYTGGGALLTNSNSTFTNCTFTGNSTSYTGDNGSALAIWTMGQTYFITNCTFANNTTAGYGALCVFYSNLIIKNTILANNSASNYNDFSYYQAGTITDNGNNIVESQYQNYLTSVGSLTTSDLSTSLGTNGTSTGTPKLALLNGINAAVDGGNDAQESHPIATPTTDQRGYTRSGTSDIGAYEYNGVLPVELTSFSGSFVEDYTLLKWTTATELNNYGFEIEKRTGSNSSWEKIGFVDGNGNSNSPKVYEFIDSKIDSSILTYRLKQIDIDGSFEFSNEIEISIANLKPNNFDLSQNYPNPFNPSTEISFQIPNSGVISLKVYDILGNEVSTLINKWAEAGKYQVKFNAEHLTSGIYIYELRSSETRLTRKMLLVK